MMGFFIVALLLMAGALLLVLTPLLRKAAHPHALRAEVNLMVLRDQLRELDADLAAGTIDAAAHASSRRDLELRVAEDVRPDPALAIAAPERAMALALGLALPLAAGALYLFLGSPGGLDSASVSAARDKPHAVTAEQIENMVARLAQRVKDAPDDVAARGMLARSYNALGRFSEAADVYAALLKLVPGNAELLADYADTLAMVRKSKSGSATPGPGDLKGVTEPVPPGTKNLSIPISSQPQ